MFKVLLHLGLIATPVFFIPGQDIRDWKMKTAVVFASALGAVGLYSKGILLKNKWLVALIAYIPVSILIAPVPQIKLVGLDVNSFWSWEPFLHIVLFTIMAGSIAAQQFEYWEIDDILKTMVLMAAATSLYMLLQFFMIDQFFKPLDSFIPGRGHVAGFIGNPTLTAPFVAMMIPIALHYRVWGIAILLGLATAAADSQIASGAAVVSILAYLSSKGWKAAIICGLMLVLGAGVIAAKPGIMEPKERFIMWKQIAKDIVEPIAPGSDATYPLTGRGIGSFKFVFHQQHPGTEDKPNRFMQAHNEYLEFTYGCGIAGLFLMLMAMFQMFKQNIDWRRYIYSWQDSRKMALLASFLCIAISAGGTFVWQIGTIAFFTTVLVGLLHNESL